MLLTILAAEAIWESGKEVLKMKGASLLEKIGDSLLSRTEEGSLPPNHNLDHALRYSLAKTARVLAYTIHDPDLSPLSKLISDMEIASFADRLAEMVQNNICEKEPTDYWLAALIDESKKIDHFKDFSLDLLLKGNQLTSLVHEQLDQRLCDHIQNEFLAWSNRHITAPNKPACFDDYVLNGWPLSGGNTRKITFFEVFCLFFREELKNNEVVFRALTVSTLVELKTDITKMLDNAPSSEERARMEEAVRKLGDFTNFKEFLESQNVKLFASLTRIEEGVKRLETGQADLKEGMELLLENQQAIFDEIKRPQMIQSVSDIDEKLPDDIKAIIQEAGKITKEGRYAEARRKLAIAKQLAETQNCAPALLEIRIDIAETHILEDSDILATRDDLSNCLRELSKDTHAKKRREVLNLLGAAESLVGNLEESRSLFREARQLAQKQQNRFAEAHALMGLSHAEEFLGNLKEANKLLDEGIELFRAEYREAAGDEKPSAAINLGACLSTKAMLVRREARLAESIVYLTKAEPFFREAKSFDNLGRTIMFKAEVLFNEAKWPEGFDALKESLSIFESIGNITWQCRCLDRMARLYFIHENGKHALACLGKALYLLGSVQRDDDAVPYLLKFAHLCQKYGEGEKAKEFIGRAQEIATKLKDDSLIAECLVAEARLLKGNEADDARKQLFVSAVKHLESALSKCEVKGRRAAFMHQIGDLYGWLRNVHEARAWFERALQEYEEIGDVTGVGECLASLASTAREEKSPAEVIAALERLLKFTEGKPLHHLRAGALHDLAMERFSQGNKAEAKRGLVLAKALAEKHKFKDVSDTLKFSEQRLDNAERIEQPPNRNLPSLIRELHAWCARYPKMAKAILPIWYYFWQTEIYSICRSMLGVRFLICAIDSGAFRRTADALREHGDLFVWGINFELKKKPEIELTPFPLDSFVPRHLRMVFLKKAMNPKDGAKAMAQALEHEAYLMLPFNDDVKSPDGTNLYVVGQHLRLAPKVYRMMLETPAEKLIAEKRICLPLSQDDRPHDSLYIMLAAWENGMIPIWSEYLPNNDKVKSICDVLLDIPSTESAASAAKELWAKLLSSCRETSQESLSDFSKEMSALSANASGEKSLRVRVYLLRFQAGSQEVVHPAAVLVSQ